MKYEELEGELDKNGMHCVGNNFGICFQNSGVHLEPKRESPIRFAMSAEGSTESEATVGYSVEAGDVNEVSGVKLKLQLKHLILVGLHCLQ